MSNQKRHKYFDFFDIRDNGALPPVTRISDGKGSMQTVTWRGGCFEGFEYGWSKETTYDLYRSRISALLKMAEQHENDSEECQALLTTAIVLTISALEVLVRNAIPRKKKNDEKEKEAVEGGLEEGKKRGGRETDFIRQDVGEFVRLVERLDGYKPIDPKDRAPLDRLFDVRHCIIHNGWRVTHDLQAKVDSRMRLQEELFFHVDGVRKVIAAADRFADCVADCYGKADCGSTEEQSKDGGH